MILNTFKVYFENSSGQNHHLGHRELLLGPDGGITLGKATASQPQVTGLGEGERKRLLFRVVWGLERADVFSKSTFVCYFSILENVFATSGDTAAVP